MLAAGRRALRSDGFFDYIKGGRVVYEDVIKQYCDETDKQFGTSFEAPTY